MSTELARQQMGIDDLIQMGVEQKSSVEQMAQLFDLKLRYDADLAQKAFNEAFTAFKAETIIIHRDKENTQYSKAATPTTPARRAMYTSLENMVATVTPFLSKHGLFHNWEIDQSNGITVTCVITHTLGHCKRVPMTGPPDTSGAKNPLQQIKSTITYLKVATFESACGLASAFGSYNDDGNASGTKERMGEADLVAAIDNISAAMNSEQLKLYYSGPYKEAAGMGDSAAMDALIAAKDKRKAELAQEAA